MRNGTFHAGPINVSIPVKDAGGDVEQLGVGQRYTAEKQLLGHRDQRHGWSCLGKWGNAETEEQARIGTKSYQNLESEWRSQQKES